MTLTGVIDAAVNGGVKRYKEAFFTPEFEAQHPEYQQELKQLRLRLLSQVEILQKGLEVHKRIRPQNLAGLHDQLESK